MTEKPIFPFLDSVGKADLSDQENPGIPKIGPGVPYAGLYVAVISTVPIGFERDTTQVTELGFTAPPGKASAVYYSTVYNIPKFGFQLAKVDEWIEVSPTRADYYQATIASKEALAGTIKQGLASAATSITDFELAKHDLRKYTEILRYFEASEKAKKIGDEKERVAAIRRSEHALRAMFIDQVDIHNGNTAMVQMVQRWSTLIADFMKLTDEHDEIDRIASDLKISKAEAVILKTKNQLYREWKNLFGTAARERYQTLLNLVESRKKSVEEYKEWVKPYLARFKMMRVGAERSGVAKSMLKSFADVTGQSTFSNVVKLWAWKPHKIVEERKPAAEKTGSMTDFVIEPYDNFVREKFVINTKTGLAHKDFYPWLADKLSLEKAKKLSIVKEGRIKPEEATKADEIAEQIKSEWKKGLNGLSPNETYYSFEDIEVTRLGVRLQSGELENVTFDVRGGVLSQNIMLVKMIELRAREMELDRYIDQMMGVQTEKGEEVSEIFRRDFPGVFGVEEKKVESSWDKFKKEVSGETKRYSDYFRQFMGFFKTPTWFVKPGAYEAEWKDRLTELILKGNAAHYDQIKSFILSKLAIE